MKKNLKRTLAKVMAVALTVALAGTAAPDADAAKKIKLSSKSITVAKGKTKKVTIKNVKKNQVKKLTVKSSKKKVATVKKSGKTAFKVTGKKAGSAKITASVTVKGKKKATKLTLKVKVQNAAKPTPAPSVAPTAAATATASAPAAGTAAPGTSSTPAPGTSGNPATQTPGTSGNPATQAPPTQVPAVESDVTEIKNVQLGGCDAEKVTFFESKDGVTDLILNSDAQYGNVFTYFDVVLPDGASVSDILRITYDVEGVSGDLADKFNSLLVGSPDADDPTAFPVDSYIDFKWDGTRFNNVLEIYNSPTYGSSFNGGKVSEVVDFTADTVALIEDLGVTGNTLRFSIFANLAGNPTEYKISNIKVYTTKGVAATEGFDKPGDTIDAVSGAEVEASISGKTSVAVGEEIEVQAVVNNPLIVGDAESVVWSSSDEDVATIKTDTENPAKATVTGVESGSVEITAAITTTKDKTAEVKATISVTQEAVEITEWTVGETVLLQGDGTDGSSSYWHAKGLEFADLDGYSSDFNISNYSSIEVTLTMYSDKEGKTPITDYSTFSKGGAKITLSADSSAVWGNGMKMFYLNNDNAKPNGEGKVVVTFKADEIATFSTATSFTAQAMDAGSIQKMVINSIVFKP